MVGGVFFGRSARCGGWSRGAILQSGTNVRIIVYLFSSGRHAYATARGNLIRVSEKGHLFVLDDLKGPSLRGRGEMPLWIQERPG